MKRKVRNIVIDLTSLLDVVMILIFAVMIQNAGAVEEARAELSDAGVSMEEMGEQMAQLEETIAEKDEKNAALSEELADLAALIEETGLTEEELNELLLEKKNAENRLDAYSYLDEIFVTVNVGLENRQGNQLRCLTYGRGTAEEVNVSIDRDDDEAWRTEVNKLAVYIREKETEVLASPDKNTVLYVIFSFDSNKVYESDCRDIQEVLSRAELSQSGVVNCRAKETGTGKGN